MSKDPWPEGQEAWGRLAGWYRAPGGDVALTALADIGVLRRLLDQVEFEAVRAARKQGRSWSEIAIRLGVTRQSAWERLRDVDDAAPTTGPAPVVPAEITARERRRQSTVTVPNVIGMSWNDARDALLRNRLVAIGPDPDDLPLTATGWPAGVVADQSPESGAVVPPGSTITLWMDRNGGAGVREPRRPKPDPKTGRKMWDEVTDEAVG
jgi:PASTA domain